MLTLLMLVAV